MKQSCDCETVSPEGDVIVWHDSGEGAAEGRDLNPLPLFTPQPPPGSALRSPGRGEDLVPGTVMVASHGQSCKGQGKTWMATVGGATLALLCAWTPTMTLEEVAIGMPGSPRAT